MWQLMKEVYNYREMLRNLVSKELRARYKGSVFGFLWTFFNPLLMLIVYSIVFSFITRSNIKNYSMFLFVGLLPWNFLSQSVLQGASSLVQGAGLIKKVYFPRVVLPLSIVVANLINYFLSLVILIPALLVFKVKLTVALLAFPMVVIIQLLFVTALTLLISIGNVYLRDLEHITGVLLMAWFFLTPILYSIEIVPLHLRFLFRLNPAAWLIEAYRGVFFYGKWPDLINMGVLAVVSIIMLLISAAIFQYFQRWVAEEI